MKELNEKELRGWLEVFKDCYTEVIGEMDINPEYAQAYKQIKQLIKDFYAYLERAKEAGEELTQIGLKIASQESQVNEKWIEEKAKVIHDYSKKWNLIDCRDFIHSIASEIQKPRITKEFVEKQAQVFIDYSEGWRASGRARGYLLTRSTIKDCIIEMLKDFCEVEE